MQFEQASCIVQSPYPSRMHEILAHHAHFKILRKALANGLFAERISAIQKASENQNNQQKMCLKPAKQCQKFNILHRACWHQPFTLNDNYYYLNGQ
jgi:hypothetical protein